MKRQDESPRFSMYDALKQTIEERGELIQLRIDNERLTKALERIWDNGCERLEARELRQIAYNATHYND